MPTSPLFLSVPSAAGAAGTQIVSADADLDLGRDFELESWSTRQQITSDLPDEVREVPGFAVGSGSVTLAAPQGAARGHFAPPINVGHLPITLTLTDGAESAPGFAGKVTGGRASAGDESITLAVEDGLSSLRGEVTVPAIAAVFRQQQLAVGCSPRWVMDTILRSAGHYTTPPMSDGCVFSAPLQGSIWPEHPSVTPDQVTGNNLIISGDPVDPVFAWSPYGEYLAEGKGSYELPPVEWVSGDVLRFAATFPVATSLAYVSLTVSDVWSVHVSVTGSTLSIEVDGTTEATIPFTPGRWCIELERTSSTGVSYEAWDESGSVATGTFTIASTVGAKSACYASVFGEICGAQISLNPAGVQAYTTHVTGTDLSPSLGSLTAVPAGIEGKAKDVLIGLAEAEFGGFWISVDGIPTFRNRDDLIGVGATPETVTSAESIADLDWSWDANAVRSAVEIPVTPIQVTSAWPSADGYRAEAWTADTAIEVAAGVTVTMIIDLDDTTVLAVDPIIRGITGSVPVAGSYFRANTSEDGSGSNYTSGNRGRVKQLGPSRLEVTLIGGTEKRWLVDADGEPAVVIRALVVAKARGEQTVRAVNLGVDADVLKLSPNAWRQDVSAVKPFAVGIAGQLKSPVATARGVTVVPNIHRRLGDVILLQDPAVTDLNVRCLITGLNRSGKPGQLTEELELRQLPWLFSDFTDTYTGDTFADFETAWTGRSFADFAASPLEA